MPAVRMLTSLATPRHAWVVGEIVQATTREAQEWVAAGIAELVTAAEPVVPERRKRRRETRASR